MKKIFLICCLLFSVTLFSQTIEKAANPCPPGTHPVLVNSCDGFRFHRPIMNCEQGFWFCSYGCTGWHWECWPDNTYQKASLDEKNVAKTWVQLIENKIEFHIPSSIANINGYAKEDLSKLNVDDELIFDFGGKKCKLVKGNYPVKELLGEFISQVDYTIM